MTYTYINVIYAFRYLADTGETHSARWWRNDRHNNGYKEEITRKQDHFEGFVIIQVPKPNIPWTLFFFVQYS